MRADRRQFLKIAGIAALGLGMKPGADLLGGGLVEASEVGALPAQNPRTGKRWGMVVDLAKCWEGKGCTDCIDACHHIHNVPHFEEPKNEVKWIWQDRYEAVFAGQDSRLVSATLRDKPALLMCNHCDNPPCVRVCPTQATWKREDGIVATDMHRCIGCRYCMVACPYGARSFNWVDPRRGLDMEKVSADFPTRTRGVVEKCTFCAERIDKGGVPACVEACQQKALLFGDLNDPRSEVRKTVESRYTMVRKPELGTRPQLYYVVS
ncbi:MAG: sulfate reduction electron transfer complex DsrMKJOP subunit DsrO [Chloroflexota bacterium]